MSHSVLIIEDEVTLAKNMKRYLERQGYEVAAVGSGEEGLAQLETFRPDMVLVDYRLPKMNGLQVLEFLQRQARKIRAIMITGQGNREVAVQALTAGAYRYAAKPLSLSDLRLLVEEAIGAPGC
jgi:two-component system, NtrC family, response regulator AtoC